MSWVHVCELQCSLVYRQLLIACVFARRLVRSLFSLYWTEMTGACRMRMFRERSVNTIRLLSWMVCLCFA